MAKEWWADAPVVDSSSEPEWWADAPLADEPPKKRTWGEAITDTGKKIASGVSAVGEEFGRLRDEVFTGVDNTKASAVTVNTAAQAAQLQKTNDRLAELMSYGEGDSPEAQGLRKTADFYAKRMPRMVGDMTEAQADAQRGAAMTTRPAVAAMGEAKTFGEAWDIFKANPYDVIAGVTATSLPGTVPALIVGAAMGPAAGAAAMGGSSAVTEAGSSIADFARESGVDTKDRKAVEAFFANRENLAAAMNYAGKRAGIIGALDTASGRIAGKTLAPAFKSGIARQAVNVPTQMAVQAGMGAGGEAGAQIATKGRIDQPGQVLMEAAGELGGAPSEVAAFSKDARDAILNRGSAKPDPVQSVMATGSVDEAIAAATESVEPDAEPAPSTAIQDAGKAWRDMGILASGATSSIAARQAGQGWQDIAPNQTGSLEAQRAEIERAGAQASAARDARLASLGQAWQDLGITDPQDDLQAQRAGMRGEPTAMQLAMQRAQEKADVSPAPDLQRPVAASSGAGSIDAPASLGNGVDAGERLGTDPTGSGNSGVVDAGVRTAVDTAGPLNFTFTKNASGTVLVNGEPAAIRAAFPDAQGMVKYTDGKPSGVLFSTRSSPDVLAQLETPRVQNPAQRTNPETTQAAPAQAPAAARPDAGGQPAARAEAGAGALAADGLKPIDPNLIPVSKRGTKTNAPLAPVNTVQVATESVADTGPIGRNNVPLSEGGKPYKTKMSADTARKNQPAMRVKRVEGGYVLVEKTPAQLAAQEKAAKRLSQPRTSPKGEPIPAHSMIAAAGGLSKEVMADMGMGDNPKVGNRRLFAAAGGLTIEEATEKLVEDGYLQEGASHSQAMDLIKRSLTNPQYTPEGTERMAEKELQEREAAFNAEQEALALAQEADDTAYDAIVAAFEAAMLDMPQGVSQSEMSMEDALLAAGFTEQELTNDTAEQTDVGGADAGAAGAVLENGQSPAEAEAGGGAQAAEGRVGTPGQDQGGREGFALSAPTREDILAQQERADAAAKEEAKADKEAADKAKADSERGEFTLTGSDRAADVGAAGGQTDIFGEAAEPTNSVDRFEVGKSLTKEQRKSVLATLVDVYKAKGAPREIKGQGRDGNERSGYVHSPELFEKSDITGAMVRYYVTLPDGRIAHPSELFPDYTQNDINNEIERRANAEKRNREIARQTYLADTFDTKREAADFWNDKSAKSIKTANGSPSVYDALGRDFITDGSKFAMIPSPVLKNQDMMDAIKAEGWKVAGPAPEAQPITPDEAANMQRGDIVRDSKGVEYYAWSARFGRLDVVPLENGKPVVYAGSTIRFALDQQTRYRRS